MPTYIGENKIIDRYLGDKFLEAAYIGDQKVYDPYAEITGYLPLIYKSRAAVALKNYRIYGTSAGAGVETENLFDEDATDINNGYVANRYLNSEGVVTTPGNPADWAISEFISVLPNTVYTWKILSGTANIPSVVEYNSENEFILGHNLNGATYVIFTTTANTTKVRVSARIPTSTLFTLGSTPPSTYIPHGYKIPILNTSGNLFNYTATDTDNGFVDNCFIKKNGTFTEINTWCVSEYIPVIGGTKYVWRWHSSDTVSAISPSIIFYDTDKQRLLASLSIEYQDRASFEFEAPLSAAYIRASVLKSEQTNAYLKKQSNYDLFIGASKLLAEEYVNYGEQKVYKRTVNIFDPNAQDPDNGFREGRFLNTNGSAVSSDNFNISEYMPIKANNTYQLYYGRAGASPCLYLYNADKDTGTGAIQYNNMSPITFTTGDDDAYIRISYRQNAIDSTMLVENELPETYIPYLQPTDPPVPLPPIPTYKGENTLSSTETLGEVTVNGRIRELNYKRLSYIKSSDGSAYIDTDIMGINAATDYIEAEMSFGALDYIEDGVVLFGCATLNDGHWNLFGAACNGYEQDATVRTNHFYSYVNYSTGGSGTIKRMRVVTNGDFSSKLLVSVKTPQSTITNLETGTVYTPSVFDPNWDAASLQPIDFVQTASFTVFAGQYYRSAGDIVYYKSHRNVSCYGARIYRNDILIHNLVPVEREDGELGLLDTITNKFYTNAGTGTFEKGEYV